MILRTKSRRAQWGCWAILFLVGLAAYAVGIRLIGSRTSAWLILARQNVAAFSAASFVFGWLAYEFRWDGVVRKGKVKVEGQGVGEQRIEPTPTHPSPTSLIPSAHSSSLIPPTSAPTPPLGEAEWLEAQKLPHSPWPTRSIEGDLAYLTLVKRAADLGFAPAQSELGDYALDRQVFAEAYYWYFCARKQGMRNLDGRLRSICLEWKRVGCPSDQVWFMLPDHESREIARALLDRDAGRNVKSAADFLASVGFAIKEGRPTAMNPVEEQGKLAPFYSTFGRLAEKMC